MSLRRRDVEQWMSHRRLPDELRRYDIFIIYGLIWFNLNFHMKPIYCSLCKTAAFGKLYD